MQGFQSNVPSFSNGKKIPSLYLRKYLEFRKTIHNTMTKSGYPDASKSGLRSDRGSLKVLEILYYLIVCNPGIDQLQMDQFILGAA